MDGKGIRVHTCFLALTRCLLNPVHRPTTTCDAYGLSNPARSWAQNVLGSALFSTFTNFHLIVETSLCSWAGLATLGGDQVWLKPSYAVGWQVPMQEVRWQVHAQISFVA